MSLKNLVAKAAYLFKKNCVMPYEYNRIVTEKNIDRMLIFCPLLTLFGFANLFITIFSKIDVLSVKYTRILYYGIIFLISFVTYFWVRILKNNPSLGGRTRNFPVSVIYIMLIILILYTCYMTQDLINCMLLFICISMITTIMFYIKPIIFVPISFISSLVLINRLHFFVDTMVIHYLNILLITFVLQLFCLTRWRSTKIELREKIESELRETALFNEIELASQVQSSFLASAVPPSDSYTVGYFTQASEGVSGDLFDFYSRDGILNGIGIFDVSGHGIAAGLITMLVKNIIQHSVTFSPFSKLEDILLDINEKFIDSKGALENYLTGILLRIKNSREIEFVSAGHPLPIVYSNRSDTADFYTNSEEERYGVIGLNDYPVKYVTEAFELESNDEIILYTDGITECMNEDGENYGKGRLLESVQAHCKEPVDEQVKSIMNDLNKFLNKSELTDDITFVILKKK